MRVVKRHNETEMNSEYVHRLAEEYKKSKEALANMEKRTNDIKKELSDIVIENGVTDENGHQWVQVGDFKLKRERRISRSLDLDAVMQWAKENDHWNDIKETIEVVDEDKLMGLA